MNEETSALSVIYSGWAEYRQKLNAAVAPLTPEQLAMQAAPDLRTAGKLITHIIRTRASWMHNALGEGGAEITALLNWDSPDAPQRSAAELLHGLTITQQLIQDCLSRWTLPETVEPIPLERNGKKFTLTRQWVIWHLIEHDLHHGGELEYTLRMHGLSGVGI